MGKKTGAAFLLAAKALRARGKISKKLLGALKLSALPAFLIISFLAVSPSKSAPEELLLNLMAMSHKGAVALCNPAHVESNLLLQIDGNFENRDFGEKFTSQINSKNKVLSGNYSKFQDGPQTVCKLRLRVAGHRFCDTDSARTQRLIGRRLQHQLAVPGEPGFYDHGYELVQDATQRTVLGWREPGQACPVDVEVVAAIR